MPSRTPSASMLGIRASECRRQPFVCPSCRYKLSTMARPPPHRPARVWSALSSSTFRQSLGPARQAPSAFRARRSGVRQLSASAPLSDSPQSQSPSQPPRFPGVFGGAASRTWGSFASNVGQSTAGSQSSSNLLPHEREARLRTAATAPPPKPATAFPRPVPPNPTPSRPQLQAQMTARESSWRSPYEEQVDMSRSVLANVFNTDRQPGSSPPSAPWTPSDRHSESNAFPGVTAELARPPPWQRRPGLGLYSNRKAAVQETTEAKDGPLPESQARESSSGRAAESTEKVAQPVAREPVAHLSDPLSPMRQLVDASKQSRSRPVGHNSSFWEELDSRSARLNSGNRATQDATKHGQGKFSASAEDADAPKPEDNLATKMTETQMETRHSRFEMDHEPNSRGRAQKKSKKANRRGRSEQDDREWDDDDVLCWEQRQRAKADKEARKQQNVPEEPTAIPIFLPQYISVSNLAQALKQRGGQFIKDMEEMGFENITADTIMTGDTAALVAMEYGFEPTIDAGSQKDLRPRPPPVDTSSLPERPPVVTIMGHVDHGKTTLLDWLRKSSVAAQEHGGITQHIGAFMVKMSSGKLITFLDTPGHAAFLSMRKRGATVTDIVVLVVAADDSVKPQTLEALKHATAAKVPIIVAINKIDKEDARIDQVKADLSRHNVEIEDYGGDVQVVCVSGKTGLGMGDLEENIVTLSEVLDVRAEADGMAEGWVLESSIKQDGKAATVLVKRGTLRLGDFVVAGKSWARIRLLRNEAGTEIDEAPPGTPVEVLGWRILPSAGEQVLQAPDEGKARLAVEYRTEMAEREDSSVQLAEQEQRQRDKAASDAAEATAAEAGKDALDESTTTEKVGVLRQNFCVKADVVGSVEAVCGSILELGNNEVRATILRSSAGQISEYDVDHAAASNSILVNFNMPVLPHIKQRAESAKVRIMDHSVIYHVVDNAKAALTALLPETVSTRVIAEADILQVFSINTKKRAFRNIAGCKVRNGSIKKTARIRVLRKGVVIYDGHIDTLKHVKKDVMEMGKGTECGIGLDGFQDFEVDDQIQTYEEIREKRSL